MKDINNRLGFNAKLNAKINAKIDEWKALKKLVKKAQLLARHPRALAGLVEERSPWLSRRVMGAASNLAEPFMIGMGLRVEKWGEETVEIIMPGGWRNQGEGGAIHSAALAALGESTARMYWEHHLDLRTAEAASKRLQVQIHLRPLGDMKGVFRLPESDREAILHQLRSQESVEIETQTLIYDRDGRLVAEVDVEWRLRRQKQLRT